MKSSFWKQISEEPFGERNPKGERFPYLNIIWIFIENSKLFSALDSLDLRLIWILVGERESKEKEEQFWFGNLWSIKFDLGYG